MAQLQFDATQHTPAVGGGQSAWPEGKHSVIVSASEIKDSKSGKMIVLTLKGIDGKTKDRTLTHNINFINKNETAQRMGQQELSMLCYCVGLLRVQDTAELHGRPFIVDLTSHDQIHKDDKGKPSDQQRTVTFNDVVGMFKIDGSLPTPAGAAAVAPAAAPAWAPGQSAAPAAPAQPQPPAPAPYVPPVPPPTPVVDNRMFYVAHNGANVTQQPLNPDGVRALGLPMDQIQVALFDGTAVGPWQPSSVLGPVAPVAPVPAPVQPMGNAPWAKPQ